MKRLLQQCSGSFGRFDCCDYGLWRWGCYAGLGIYFLWTISGFLSPVLKDGKILVQPPREVLDLRAKQWDNALLGSFLGKSPPLGVFQRTVNKLWGREGSVEIRREVHSQVEHVVGVSKDVVVPTQQENTDAIGVVSNKQVNDDVTGHELDMLGQGNDDIVSDVVGVNKFVALCDAVEQDGAIRPVRVTAGGVVDLMERLKPKEKGGKKKGKGRGVGKDRGLKDGASPGC
ncbi:hypothetical protein V6N11_023990 [Hibiscus sabdariffa]|uniref:Uncharacterized protein n=1 Tax=Hibiscus sabdariffa TaxID=183260 RepID=A0ABR2TPG1_9ROSI